MTRCDLFYLIIVKYFDTAFTIILQISKWITIYNTNQFFLWEYLL